MAEEMFEIVEESGRVIGLASRRACHTDPRLIHQSVHVLVFNRAGALFLQKRSGSKDVEPGKWDTSVGGHVRPGEDPAAAARREMEEELGVPALELRFVDRYLWRSPTESELVSSYVALHDGPFDLEPEDIDDGRFWSLGAIEDALGSGWFTPHFEAEFERWRNRTGPRLVTRPPADVAEAPLDALPPRHSPTGTRPNRGASGGG